jgi:hypothetical protein
VHHQLTERDEFIFQFHELHALSPHQVTMSCRPV